VTSTNDCTFRLSSLGEGRGKCLGQGPDWIAPQEGGRRDELFEFCTNTGHHVFHGELGELVHNLQGIYGWGFDWVDEPEEDLEVLCGLCDMDYGGGENDFVGVEILELS
jgi:hypothetical protein